MSKLSTLVEASAAFSAAQVELDRLQSEKNFHQARIADLNSVISTQQPIVEAAKQALKDAAAAL